MKKQSKRALVLTLWVLLGVAVIVVIGYFVYTYARLKDSGVTAEQLEGRIYMTENGEQSLRFDVPGSFAVLATTAGTERYTSGEVKEGILTLRSGTTESYYIIMDERTLFGGGGQYLYLYEVTG